jgi:hypothetical protein
VSKIEFFKREAKTYSLDPKEGFNRKELVFEIRRDNLTGHIIPNPSISAQEVIRKGDFIKKF